MKFKARFIVEQEKEIEARSVEHAATIVEEGLNIVRKTYKAKLLGVIPVDQEWPDAEKPAPRPPRNTPPSGSPGTPVVTAAAV